MTVTRFAPSPTGYLHVGNLRTALFNFLIAKKAGGQFILRLDDTDPARSKPEYADAIKQDLEWLGLTWDRVETQSSRLDLYAQAADKLREIGRFYECFESPTELDLKRKKQLNMGKPPVYDRASLGLSEDEKAQMRAERDGYWRFKLDHERIEWTDGILGGISIDAASVSDPVLIRADGQVLYTLASVVDDTGMGVTDVVRGSDHVTNTATQVQIMAALGFEAPRFAHHSLLTGPQGEGLSKRFGTLALRDLRERGIEPMALLSHMARIGSSDPIEVRASMDEIVAGFDISRFGAPPTKYDVDDLVPLSGRVLGTLPLSEVAADLVAAGVPQDKAPAFWDAIRQNIVSRAGIGEWWAVAKGERAREVDAEDAEFVAEALKMLPEGAWDTQSWSAWTAAVKDKTGRKGKGLFRPLRIALTGREQGPDMGAFMALMERPKG